MESQQKIAKNILPIDETSEDFRRGSVDFEPRTEIEKKHYAKTVH